MIPEKLHEQIPLYVMGELEALEAAGLETLMARSPELRAEVRACAEALAEVAAESAAPVRRSTAMWNVIERRVEFLANDEAARPASIRVQPPQRPPVHRGWAAWAWPAAAAVLVLLNIAQWWWRQPARNVDDAPATASNHAGATTPNHRATDANQVTPSDVTERANDPMSLADLMSFDVDHATPEQIRAAYRLLTQKYQRLEKDYVAISENVVPLLWSAIAEQRNSSSEEKTTPGLLSMELRGLTESQPQTVAGLWDRVRDLIGDNAIAIVTDRWRLPGGVVLDPAWWNSRGNANVGPAPGFTVDSPPPFALAAVNNAEGLGYLDIYNLPAIPAGQELRLWVQSEGQTDYTAVGNVPPALVGGSGALAFRLPALKGPPSRFLITTEPVGQSPQPAGVIVIEGP